MNKITRDIIISLLSVMFGASLYFAPTLALFLAIPLGVAIYDSVQTKHSLLRNYPLLGRLRWIFEHERTKIQQYFIEHDTNGTPYNREKRSDVYQKAKGDNNTVPFGTQLNVYQKGYEFIQHSMYPKDIKDVTEPRVKIGSKFCRLPYSASVLNISAMSYGALSDAAVTALNRGAKLGNFFHNSGEGGISKHHLQGGDVCFQIGTGYFGAGKTVNGKRYFDETQFRQRAINSNIKLIEIKLSQGAKPGHGGILPAKKNTNEIAEIRGVQVGTEVASPPYHTAFTNPVEMLDFIEKLRDLSGGKPIGIKMCVGNFDEVKELIYTMKELDRYPDFITIDGGEGGTGAAPLVFTNSIGTPLIDGMTLVNNLLVETGLKSEIKLIVSGKASTSFDIVKLLALGADCVNAARAFMLSLGCIQARECNNNTCPVGVATQDRKLVNGLDPTEKSVRVYNYHKKVVHEIREVLGAMGLTSVTQLKPEHIKVRVDDVQIKNYSEIIK
jgi:glutamate synthase domain-containing protein 2